MGFDINILMELYMCPETGMPYVYKNMNNRAVKVYGFVACVPEHLRKYLVGRGYIFKAYTEHFGEDSYEADIGSFLNRFPSWDQVVNSEWYEPDYADYWKKDDHDAFRELIVWCHRQEAGFRVHWSY